MDSGFEILPVNLSLGAPNSDKVSSGLGVADPAASKGVETKEFASVLADAGNELVQAVQKAEATSIAGIKGDATTYEVAASMIEAEQSLKMAIAVRDRIVNAYLEITRMQI